MIDGCCIDVKQDVVLLVLGFFVFCSWPSLSGASFLQFCRVFGVGSDHSQFVLDRSTSGIVCGLTQYFDRLRLSRPSRILGRHDLVSVKHLVAPPDFVACCAARCNLLCRKCSTPMHMLSIGMAWHFSNSFQ